MRTDAGHFRYLAGGIVAVAVLTSCGGTTTPSGARASGTPSASATPAAGWEWADDDVTAGIGVPADVASTTGTPGGTSLGTMAAAPTPSTAPSTGTPRLDPCRLVTVAQWTAWTTARSAEPISLEYGQVCGWKNDADTVRMAIGAFEATGGERWLQSQQAPAGQPVAGLGERATWLAQWPLQQASTLVVESGAWDVVVEMDSRGGPSDAALLEGATGFARAALPQLTAG